MKEINIVEKTFEIARDRGLTTEDLLRFDIAPSPLIFTEDSMMTHPNKSNLLKELEVYLNPEDYCYKHKVNASFVIDVMANLRKVSVSPTSLRLSYFQDIVLALASLCSVYHQYGRCDYVFEMYSECPSTKVCERRRRSEVVPIEYSSVKPGRPLPKKMETFRPSNNNKLNLETLIYCHVHVHIPL